MKKPVLLLGILLFIFFFLSLPSRVWAACKLIDNSPSQAQICRQQGKYPRMNYRLDISGSAQCTGGNQLPNGTYSVCCDFQTEANSVDSVRAPLCGSSEELGQTNSTCWECGGDIKCSGLSFALGGTSSEITAMSNRAQIAGTDEDINNTWRVINVPESFTFNGIPYESNGRGLVICNANVLGCGDAEGVCHNILFPNIGHEPGTPDQCQLFTFTSAPITVVQSTAPITGPVRNSKGCINIGDWAGGRGGSIEGALSAMERLSVRGWVYIMARPEWFDSIAATISQHPQYNYMIRLHYPGTPLDEGWATAWGDALARNASRLTTRVWLMPVNEPNVQISDRQVDPLTVRVFISALAARLNNAGVLNTRYLLTSPMIDPYQVADQGTGYLDALGGKQFFSQFAAFAIAPYGQYSGSQLDGTAHAYKQGLIADLAARYAPGKPIVIAETGVALLGNDPLVVYSGAANQTVDYLTRSRGNWQNAIATCMFNYDPDRQGVDNKWLYSNQNVLRALFGLGPGASVMRAQSIAPSSDPVTVNYETCLFDATYQRVGEAPIPSNKTFGCVDDGKFVFCISDAVHHLFGEAFPHQQKTNVPPVSREARQLKTASPYLTPLTIQEVTTNIPEVDKPGDKPLAISFSGSVCAPESETQTWFLPTGIWETPYLDNSVLLQFSEITAATIGRHKMDPAAFNFPPRYPNRIIKDKDGPRCDERDHGTAIETVQLDNFNKHKYYEGSEFYSAAIHLSQSLIQRVLQGIASGNLCPLSVCNITKNLQKFMKLGSFIPYSDEMNQFVKGETKGFTNAFLPMTVLNRIMPIDHSETDQMIAQGPAIGTGGEPVLGKLILNHIAGIKTNIYAMNCAILPMSKQKEHGFNCEDFRSDSSVANTSTWALEGDTTPLDQDFSIPLDTSDVGKAITEATQGKIPRCILEAVKYIETGPGWEPSTQCRINRCSAAGPFQITTGYAPYPMPDGVYQMPPGSAGTQLSNQCRQCGSSWADGSRTCPDAWNNNWPMTPSDISPCDINASARQAVSILQQKSQGLSNSPPQSQARAIMLAGNRYFGSAASIPRLNGCSYGEYIYQHCVPSYQCGTANPGI